MLSPPAQTQTKFTNNLVVDTKANKKKKGQGKANTKSVQIAKPDSSNQKSKEETTPNKKKVKENRDSKEVDGRNVMKVTQSVDAVRDEGDKRDAMMNAIFNDRNAA